MSSPKLPATRKTTLPKQPTIAEIFSSIIEDNKVNLKPTLLLRNEGKVADEIPEEVFELTHLRKLHLAGFDLETLPDGIYNLHELRELSITDCQLKDFPVSLRNIPYLGFLSIGSAQLTVIPEEAGQWKQLYYLNVSDCPRLVDIVKLPPNLNYLHIGEAGLTEIPNAVFSLKLLNKLVLHDMKLTSLPVELFEISTLEHLFLSKNHLKELPIELGKLKNLKQLMVYENEFEKLPEIISSLKKLKEFNISHNKLTDLPNSFKNLKRLSNLDLSNNNFSKIPHVIFDIPSLVTLQLHSYGEVVSNGITYLPYDILKLKKLKNFSINSVTNVPDEILDKDFNMVRNYLTQLQNQEHDYLFEAKLLVLGEPGAGKTSLTWKLEDPARALPGEGDSTKGITVKKHHFQINDNDLPNAVKGQQKNFCLNIWDFGGQEIYKSTHRFFLSNRALYILVSDTRKEETDFNYWLHIVEIFGDQSPLLVVLNEKEGHTNSVDGAVLRGRFDNIQQILHVNLLDDKDTTRLDIIKSHIEFYAAKLAHVGSVVPAKWKAVREAIEANAEDMISVQDYFAVCKKYGIDKQTDALVLSQYFHDIGVFLHFQKDAILKKTLFLNPTWATSAVYKVLDHPILNQKNGRFSKVDADIIWHEDEFASVRDELLRLMQNFFLTYEISETEEYIVPEKLSYEKPAYEWSDTGNLILQYEYKPFMPKGLLAQFIVKMNRYIADHAMVWRKGVVLRWQDTLAEVTETYDVGTIQVRVTGKNKRDFMTLITAQFDAINEQYRKLNIRQLIPCNCPDCKALVTPHFYDLKILQRRVDKNQPTIQCEIDYRTVNVKGLLYDVFNNDLLSNTKSVEVAAMPETKKADSSSVAAKKKIFISYAHTDEKYLTRLLTHFKVLEHEGIELDVWSDKRLKSGIKWRKEIEKAMQECQVAILLVSTDFLASKFITQTELPAILRGAEERGVVIMPMVLTSCRYTQNKDLKEFQAQNDPAKPLVKLTPDQRDEEYMRLLDRVIEELVPAE